jgi:hypothetical protein
MIAGEQLEEAHFFQFLYKVFIWCGNVSTLYKTLHIQYSTA